MITSWWGLALLALGVAAVAMLLTAYAARRAGRVSVVDVTWGLALAAIAVAAAVAGTGTALAALGRGRARGGPGRPARAAHPRPVEGRR